MKSVLIGILVIWLFSQSGYAQDTTKNSLKQSKFALQFQIDNNFTLKSFQGSTLSFKYHILDESAIRLGFSISSYIETYKEEDHIEKPKGKSFDITLNAQFIQYLKTFEDISLYTGGGSRFSYDYNIYGPSGNNKNWSLGLDGILGVEWFFKKNMSLSAEYGILINYNGNEFNGSPNEPLTSTKGNYVYITDNNMLKFGISIYI